MSYRRPLRPSELTDSDLQQVTDDYRGGLTCKQVAEHWNLNPRTLSSWFSAHEISKSVRIKSAVSLPDVTDDEISTQVVHDREMSGLKAQANHYKRLYATAVRSTYAQDMIVEAVRNTVQAMPLIRPQSVPKVPVNSYGQHTVVVHLSDLHNGEVVDADVIGIGDGFDADILRQRLGRWIKKVLLMIDIWRTGREIPRLVVLLDGDMISGIIHDELEITNDLNIVEQTSETAMLVASAIAQISAYFPGGVHVSCTVGNHGRTKQKKEMKEPQVSWDAVCYQMMAQFLVGYDHITFDIPKSKWAITSIENMNWLHWHGDGIKSWAGIPYYGIDRAVKNIREALMIGDKTFDSLAMGHFHVPFTHPLPTGKLVVNGCFKGGDEYAMNGLFKHTDPVQHIYLVSTSKGHIETAELFLKGQTPEDGLLLPERLSTVWADTKL